MKAASLKEIKTELSTLHPKRIQEICIQMAKFKKENKELLTYLLFETDDENAYINEIKSQLDVFFNDVNKNNVYLAKKTIRKIIRISNKYIKFSVSKQTEVEIRIFLCKKMKKTGLPLTVNTVLGNIYKRQYEKLTQSLSILHEDLQYDYSLEIRNLYF